MSHPADEIRAALEVLGLPVLVSFKEIKSRYHLLSRRHHPDLGGESKKMEEINSAYRILKEYIENYKFSFSDEEIEKQFPHRQHANRFRF